VKDHFHSYIRSAAEIIQQYRGEEPLSSFLKKFFSARRKYGSRDRKMIAHLCYCYYRMGKLELTGSTEEKILNGLFLCSNEHEPLVAALSPSLAENINLSPEEKLKFLGKDAAGIFPWGKALSGGIGQKNYGLSFLIQPDLFLRVRPGHMSKVREKLSSAGILFSILEENCIALPNTTKIDTILEADKEVVIQDLNSQRVGDLLKDINLPASALVWDCCAGSGGKSILAQDLLSDIDLTVTDNRSSILFNLKKRFQGAGMDHYACAAIDLLEIKNNQQSIINNQYSLIIADLPCTGSGTWSRTPEQLYFFDPVKIDSFSALQKKISANVMPYVKEGGYFLYITCSVFRKENEEVVEFLMKEYGLRLLEMKLLTGYEKKADTIFATMLQKQVSPA
jgi:16S rRNA (cytosine967-C5)-methyltransferase